VKGSAGEAHTPLAASNRPDGPPLLSLLVPLLPCWTQSAVKHSPKPYLQGLGLRPHSAVKHSPKPYLQLLCEVLHLCTQLTVVLNNRPAAAHPSTGPETRLSTLLVTVHILHQHGHWLLLVLES
jgi:hypothetical protein